MPGSMTYFAVPYEACTQQTLHEHGVAQLLQWISIVGCSMHAQGQLTSLDGPVQRFQQPASHAAWVSMA